MVHDIDFNQLPDSVEFATSYDRVGNELREKYKKTQQAKGGSEAGDANCLVS
jgi:hypothetical protein